MIDSNTRLPGRVFLAVICIPFFIASAFAQTQGFATIHADMVYNMSGLGRAHHLFDQDQSTVFEPRHQNGFDVVPAEVVLRLKPQGSNLLTHINFRAAHGAKGSVQIFTGRPDNWQPLSAAPLAYGNGVTGLAWYPIMQNVKFLKFVFRQLPGDTQPLSTGDLFLNISGDYLYTDLDACPSGQSDCRKAVNSFDTFMGVNNFLGKTQLLHQFAPFTGVREYLPWDHIQGHINSGTSVSGRDHAFQFSPAFPGYDIDRHYANLAGAGKELLVDLKESSPFQMYFDYNGGHGTTLNQLGLSWAQLGGHYLDLMERKPGRPEGGVHPNALGFQSPATYENHSEAVFQTALRFGKNGNTTRHHFRDGAGKGNQNTAKWIENWNEQDKWWTQLQLQAPIQGDKEKRLQFFTPKEYMAMTFADHKPKSGDLALPMVMSGLAELDVEYLKGMYISWWELSGSDPSINGNWPFKAINYHHYSVKDWQYGIAPEKDNFIDGQNPQAHLSRVTAFVQKYLPQSELWITEFGYSDHPNEVTTAKANYPNADLEEVQAQWILRSYLHYYRYGVDRAFAYQLLDDGPNQWASVFNHTGFIDRTDSGGGAPTYRYKKAWYYTYTLKQHLAGLYFAGEQNSTTPQGRPLRRYDFSSSDGQRKASALWVPDDTNPTAAPAVVATNGHKKVQLIRFTHEKIAGTTEVFEDHDSDGYITLTNIGERPVLLLWDTLAPKVAECGCNTNLALMSGSQQAFSAITDTKSFMTNAEHPKCNYGPQGHTIWEGTQADSLVLNIGGGTDMDTWAVDAIYVHDPAWNQGTLTLELLDTAHRVVKTIKYAMDGAVQYPYNTQGSDYVWKTYDGIATKAARLRVTRSAGLRVGEIIVCAQPSTHVVTSTPVTPTVPPVAPPPPPPPSPPAPAPPSTCDCVPFAVVPVQARYELFSGQVLPSSNTLFDACLDQLPDKHPSRMFDEQDPNVLGKICSNQYDLQGATPDFTHCSSAQTSGYPVTEWFPGWSNQYPFKVVVDFGKLIEFTGLYLYDSNDEGMLSFEYREGATGQWKSLSLHGSKTVKTSGYRKWRKIFESNQVHSAMQLRVTMHSHHARFSELAFCAPRKVRKPTEEYDAEIDILQDNESQHDEDEVGGLRQIQDPSRLSVVPILTSVKELIVYPNPTRHFVNVDGIGSEITHFELYDMTGRRLDAYQAPGRDRVLTIDVRHLPAGVYILSAYEGSRPVQMERIVVR